MTIYYSKTTKGFYLSDIHGDNIPEDKIEISEALHKVLLKGQSEGKTIEVNDKGLPDLTDTPVLSEEDSSNNKNSRLLREIRELEQYSQPRAMRDAVLYNDKTRLTELDNKISKLRSQLK